ncbi:hypothetical protein HYV43_00480 [Candidatus Micrarchaeota archaeon]|nr:hypothetical protein [Candidatus Micrarchaeota archaeon]
MADDEGLAFFIKSIVYFPYIVVRTLVYLIFNVLPAAYEIITQIGGWLLSIPFQLIGYVHGMIFAKQIRQEKQRKARKSVEEVKNEQGRLLLEYEELLKKKDRLKRQLWGATGKLEEFKELVQEYEHEDQFETRMTTGAARKSIRAFDFGNYGSIEDIAELAGQLEDAKIRAFAIEQELKYCGFKRKRSEYEEAKI